MLPLTLKRRCQCTWPLEVTAMRGVSTHWGVLDLAFIQQNTSSTFCWPPSPSCHYTSTGNSVNLRHKWCPCVTFVLPEASRPLHLPINNLKGSSAAPRHQSPALPQDEATRKSMVHCKCPKQAGQLLLSIPCPELIRASRVQRRDVTRCPQLLRLQEMEL